MADYELALKKPESLADTANGLAVLVWKNLNRARDFPVPDPHRFPLFAHAIHEILQRHIGSVLACIDTEYHDSWARTASVRLEGGPIPGSRARQAPALQTPDLSELLREIELEIVEFLSRHDAKRLTRQQGAMKAIHDLIRHEIQPYLSNHFTCTQRQNPDDEPEDIHGHS